MKVGRWAFLLRITSRMLVVAMNRATEYWHAAGALVRELSVPIDGEAIRRLC
jgi:hypothetical protein